MEHKPPFKAISNSIHSKADLSHISSLSNTGKKTNPSNDNRFLIHFRKNSPNNTDSSGASQSHIQINTSDKKISFNLIEDKDFFRTILISSNFNQFKAEMNSMEKSHTFCEGKPCLFSKNIDLSTLQVDKSDNSYVPLEDFKQLQMQQRGSNIVTYSRIKSFPCTKSMINPMSMAIINESLRHSNDFLILTKQQLLGKSNLSINHDNSNSNSGSGSNNNSNVVIINHNSTSYYNKSQSINSHVHIVRSQTNATPNPNVIANANANAHAKANEALSIPENFFICELCEWITPLILLRTIHPCQHCFCLRCGKHFYEDKIEQGETEFKCPYYYCLSQLPNDLLNEFVSKNHIERLSRLLSSHPCEIVKGTINTANCDRLAKGSTFFTTLKDYNKKHVIDISQNDSAYLLYQKHKDYICNKCNLLSLFGKNYTNTLKCLNCLERFCKYCMQLIGSLDHFNIRSDSCCKSYKKYYNEHHRRKTTNYCPVNSLRTLTFFLVSYMIILLAGCIFIRDMCQKLLCLTIKAKRVEHRMTLKKTIKNFSIVSQSLYRTGMTKAKHPKTVPMSRRIAKCLANTVYYVLVSFLCFIYIAIQVMTIPYYPCLFFFLEGLCIICS